MSPTGAADMIRALQDLRKSLDELCGATARAGWIVDTWSAYQHGKLDASNLPEPNLGSAAIDGIELDSETGEKSGLQAPIGRPVVDKSKKRLDGGEMSGAKSDTGVAASHGTDPAASAAIKSRGTFRPPPGLAFPLTPGLNAEPASDKIPFAKIRDFLKANVGPSLYPGDAKHELLKPEITAPKFPKDEELNALKRHFVDTHIGPFKTS